MKIYVCLVISLLSVSLCTADITFPSTSTVIVSALLECSIADSNYIGPAVTALSECNCPGIIFGGSGIENDALTIFNGGIHVNSPYNPGGNDGALDKLGNAPVTISANYINVVGGIDERFDFPEGIYVHDYTDGIQPVPDPYAYIPPHDLTAIRSLPDKGTIADSNTYSPGYYSGGMQVSDPGTTITLLPGDYYLDSIGYDASMEMIGGLLTGTDVTLHIIGDADHGIDVGGNSNLDISAPDDPSTYAGVAIYQKRDPTYDCAQSCAYPLSDAFPISEFNGSGIVEIDGAVYMPHNRLELGGTGDIYLTRVVADRIYINGTGQKVVGYDGNVYVPGDLDKNGTVDIDDLEFFCWQWGLDHPFLGIYIESNLNYDLNLDLGDFAIFAAHWLEETE